MVFDVPAHMNVNIGKPLVDYSSYSYALRGNTRLENLNNLFNPFAEDYKEGFFYEDVGGRRDADVIRWLYVVAWTAVAATGFL